MDTILQTLSRQAGTALKQRGWILATAESCTGGWVSEAITAISGSSTWFDRGFVTYSNAAKIEMLGVNSATLQQYGAVSEPVVKEMVAGALTHSAAHVAVAISGIAGPTGGSPEKPVGTVCFAWQLRNHDIQTTTLHLHGERGAIRRQSVIFALQGLLALTEKDQASD